MPKDKLQRMYRVRVVVFLLCVILFVSFLSTTYQAIQTLGRLDEVERERDQWQRPAEILQALHLKQGSVVVDLGCGAGYFALKLSPLVGIQGRVLAVDIRRVSLLFLWIRAALRREHNITVIHSEPDDPHLRETADAVLIANTYHELTHPKRILGCVFKSLRRGGRLAVVDRGPESAHGEARDVEMQHHELPLDLAKQEIQQSGFEIMAQEHAFIHRPGDEPWWLIVAQKP
jgi:predicted methyltransferase